jgi:hypothetical protein
MKNLGRLTEMKIDPKRRKAGRWARLFLGLVENGVDQKV